MAAAIRTVFFGALLTLALSTSHAVEVELASPPLYRKVQLTGRPARDAAPENRLRTDEEPEETYVDALTLRLQHCTTDIYIPMGSELIALSVRRNLNPVTWKADSLLLPARQPDLPFGNGWTSGLAANLHFVRNGRNVVRAIVTDEDGTLHFFATVQVGSDGIRCLPLGNARTEQDSAKTSLDHQPDGKWAFRRKYGNKMLFEEKPWISLGDSDAENHVYHRAASASDRFGTRIEYHFRKDNPTLIPDELAWKTMRVLVERNADGRVERIVDPNGYDILFEYRPSKLPGGASLLIKVRGQIVDGDRPRTGYDYEEASQESPGKPTVYACEIRKIVDPLDKFYTFEHVFVPDGEDYSRVLRRIGLPDGKSESLFQRYVVPSSSGGMEFCGTFVTDAAGDGTLYEFRDFVVESIRAARTDSILNRIMIFRKQTMSSFEGNQHAFLPETREVRPGKETTLVGTESYEFDLEAGGALARAVDFSGNATLYEYGAAATADWGEHAFGKKSANPLARRDALGGVTRYDYAPFSQLALLVDAEGRVRTFDYTGPVAALASEKVYASEADRKRGVPFCQTDFEYKNPEFPGFVTRRVIRKTSASPEKIDWECDLVTDFECDELGFTTREISDPDGVKFTKKISYDPNGNRESVEYSDGRISEFKYDPRNRIARIFRPSREKREMQKQIYDRRGNEIREEAFDGAVTIMTYDDFSRLIKSESFRAEADSPHKVISFAYNPVGGRILSLDSEGNQIRLEQDALGRHIRSTYEDRSFIKYTYGPNSGSLLFENSVMEPVRTMVFRGGVTEVEYDALCRKVREVRRRGGVSVKRIYEYDAVGNLVRERAPDGGITTYIYDPIDQLVCTVLPDGRKMRVFHTSTGLKYAKVDADGKRKERIYDAAGHVVSGSLDDDE